MDREEKIEMSKSSAAKETTPLLSKDENSELSTKEIKPARYDCVAGPSRGGDSAAACASNTREKDETAGSTADGEILVETEEAEKHLRVIEEQRLADAINSYEGMADIVTPVCGCGLIYGIWLCMCHCLSIFIIQFPLHVLLLGLPISYGFMGARYMDQCPMNVKLPYTMMVVGGMGTLVLLVRITLLLHAKYSADERLRNWLRKWTKLLECLFLLSFIVQLIFSFEKTHSEDPLSLSYCNPTFYNFFSSMNNVLITLVVVWVFLYCITRQRCLRRASPP